MMPIITETVIDASFHGKEHTCKYRFLGHSTVSTMPGWPFGRLTEALMEAIAIGGNFDDLELPLNIIQFHFYFTSSVF